MSERQPLTPAACWERITQWPFARKIRVCVSSVRRWTLWSSSHLWTALGTAFGAIQVGLGVASILLSVIFYYYPQPVGNAGSANAGSLITTESEPEQISAADANEALKRSIYVKSESVTPMEIYIDDQWKGSLTGEARETSLEVGLGKHVFEARIGPKRWRKLIDSDAVRILYVPNEKDFRNDWTGADARRTVQAR